MADTTYEKTSKKWRGTHSVVQYIDARVTASQGGTSGLVKTPIFLARVERWLSENDKKLSAKPQKVLADLIKALEKKGEGITKFAQFDEDTLTLLVMPSVCTPPHRMVLFPLLREWGILDGEPSKPAFTVGWPYISRDAIKDLGYKEGKDYLTPDWLVETPEHLVFVEFKPPTNGIPSHQTPEKLGRMIVLGDRLAQLTGRRFTMAAMVEEDGDRVRFEPGGKMSLPDAVDRSLDAVVEAGLNLYRPKAQIASTVVPLRWGQIRQGLSAAAARLADEAAADPWIAGQYAPILQVTLKALNKALENAWAESKG